MQLEFKFVEQTFKVRDQEITFTEKIAYDENGEEVYHRETEMENDIKLYDIYKQRSGLLTTTELKELREKHNLSQKELAEQLNIHQNTLSSDVRGSNHTILNIKEINETQSINLAINTLTRKPLFESIKSQSSQMVDFLIYSSSLRRLLHLIRICINPLHRNI